MASPNTHTQTHTQSHSIGAFYTCGKREHCYMDEAWMGEGNQVTRLHLVF